jgi:hypothetical protein
VSFPCLDMDKVLRVVGMGSLLNDMGKASTLVSRVGYTEDSAYRGWETFGVWIGNVEGSAMGWSAVRVARAEKLVRLGGGVRSEILCSGQKYEDSVTT